MRTTSASLLHAHPKTHNTWEGPEQVSPAPLETNTDDEGTLRVRLPGPSLAVLRLATRS
jgi:hypothetical protein